MTTLKVGIASYAEMKARTLAVARGEKRVRGNDPKVWFTSMESFAKVLSDRNRALLTLIAETQPGSLAELSQLSGRAKSNLSRTLKTMERYGLVQLRKGLGGTIAPRVPYSGIDLAVSLEPHMDTGARGQDG
jgi:predicted transcriptional regulator